MIKTFRSRGPELLFARKSVALFHPIELARGIEPMVRRKLAQLNAADALRDLAVPSESCLASVTPARTSEYSIRVNHAWQLCFVWHDRDAYDVDLVPNYAVGKPRARPENGLLQPIHPGEILLQDFMRPHLIGVDKLSSVVGVPPTQIIAVLDGKRAITADAAFGLGSFLGTTTELWLNLQRDHDMQLAETAKLEAIDRDAKAPI
jgi:addiction module HigA family antidote